MSRYLERTISNLVQSQFPSFYLEEGPLFIEFTRVYYEWLESQTASKANTWIGETLTSIAVQSGNTVVVGTRTKLDTHFANGDQIAISRDANTANYSIYTINTISNSTYMTLVSAPDFSLEKTRYTSVSNTGNPLFFSRRFDEVRDIDGTFENFLVHFKEKYLKSLQFINITNTRNLVKHSLDLYRAKGTERAVELLFKIAFGVTPRVYYPSSDLFRLSDGVWFVPRYLEVSLNEDVHKFVNKQIVGLKSGATAFAESVIRRTVGSKFIDVIYISAINGNFQTGEIINTEDKLLDVLNCPVIIGSLNNLIIDENGIGSEFEIGDVLDVTSTYGQQARARVSEISNVSGLVTFTLENGGYGYSNNSRIVISEKVITISNVVSSNSVLTFFDLDNHISQPLANISYVSANGSFTLNENVFTYYANNLLKGSGRVLAVAVSNTTAGYLLSAVLSGNLQSNQFFTTANAIVANQSAYAVETATGNVVGVVDQILIHANNATGTFANDALIYQYDANNDMSAYGTIDNGITTITGSITVSNTGGKFHRARQIYTAANTFSANIVSLDIYVGIIESSACSFVDTEINYVYSGNQSTNGYISLISSGSGANVVLSSNLLYSEYINLNTDFILPYVAVNLNATTYGFPGNTTANLTNMAIANALTYSNTLIGKLSMIVSMSKGTGYTEKPVIRVIEPLTVNYQIKDRFTLAISNVSSGFETGELVTQTSTGARGIVISSTNTSIFLERLNFNDANTWIVTGNSTTFIVGSSSGASANIVIVSSVNGDYPIGADAVIELDLNVANGAITEFEIIDSGFGFVDGETVTITSNTETFSGNASLTTHGTGAGLYLQKGGFLSDDKKLFDGYYFQNYSYEIRSSKTLDKYADMLRNVVHVAGTKPFAAFYYDTEASVNSSITSTITVV